MTIILSSLYTKLLSFIQPPDLPGDSKENPLNVDAVPGLVTLLDVTLLSAVEGQLTATLTSSHALLAAWLDLKQQAVIVLHEIKYSPGFGPRRAQTESFARACLDAACNAIESLTIDKLAQSANLSDPFEHPSSTFSSSTSGYLSSSHQQQFQNFPQSLRESHLDTGRRGRPLFQRARDCWESPRLHCPDYVWADEAAISCQKILRQLSKHPFQTATSNSGGLADTPPATVSTKESIWSTGRLGWLAGLFIQTGRSGNRSRAELRLIMLQVERQTQILLQLIHIDIPTRLIQFRTAMEAESVVSKRLYLVKCEYRAPFRAFLEAHHSVLKAPSIKVVENYLHLPKAKLAKVRSAVKEQFQELLRNPALMEALAIEQCCEEYETEMAKKLHLFCELARYLDQKRARIKRIPGVVTSHEHVVRLQDRLFRLKGCLCRKAGPDATTGIRPILLDLQGVPRDDDKLDSHDENVSKSDLLEKQVSSFVQDMETLAQLCEIRNSFYTDNKKADVDLPASIVRGISDFDGEVFSCQFLDWYDLVVRQDELTSQNDFEELAEDLRNAELQIGLAAATTESLEMVRERVEMIKLDRMKRFQVLKNMIEVVCLREMNLHINLLEPPADKPLPLQPMSALGVFGLPLLMAREVLPIG